MNANFDEAMIRQFEDCSLPLEALRHSVHIEIAFLYLCKYPVLDVLARFPAALARYAEAHGKAGLYHETITWAYLFIVSERVARAGETQTWEHFRATNPDLLDCKTPLLRRYYRDETLASAFARERFLMPDDRPEQKPSQFPHLLDD